MITQSNLHYDPYAAVNQLVSCNNRIVGCLVVDWSETTLALDLRLAPPLELEAHGYPTEPVRLVSKCQNLAPFAIPLRRQLVWRHRYGVVAGDPESGALCLWYPEDPESLRWTWRRGFESFVALVQRHLIFEEAVRRGHDWPGQEAPHGFPTDGSPRLGVGGGDQTSWPALRVAS